MNQFGATEGGPLYIPHIYNGHDKTFFFIAYEGYRQNWGWVHGLDWSLLNAAHDVAIKHPAWVRFWDVVSVVLGPVPLRLLGAATAVALLVKRNVRAALLVVACAPLNGLVTTAAKALVT